MSGEMTIRDHFAAAALTGLIAQGCCCDPVSEAAPIAYAMADAMLRERAATNHGAAPAAIATSDESRADTPAPSHRDDSTGDTRAAQEPVAWAHLMERTAEVFQTFRTRDQAAVSMAALQRACKIVPLYRDPPPPTLTDAEREAISNAAHLARLEVASNPSDKGVWQSCYSTLRALLARMGGDA